jgi:hypothetical protein
MTTAQKIKSGEREPTQAVKDMAVRVKADAKRNLVGLEEGLRKGELRNRAHFEAVRYRLNELTDGGTKELVEAKKGVKQADKDLLDAFASGQITEANAQEFSGLTRDEANEVAQVFFDDWSSRGCYAYGFLEMDDGSILAVYVTGPGKPVRHEAFRDMNDTTDWHPTRSPHS